MRAIVKGIDGISTAIGYVGAWVMAPLIVSMVYEVLARHLFGAPTFWAYEVGYMLAGTCYMFGMAYCMKVRGHVRVDFIYDQLNAKGKAVVDIFGWLILVLPGGIWVTWGLWEYMIEAYDYGEVSGESAWNPVVWPFRTVWAIGFMAICLQTVAEILKCLAVLRGNPIEESEA